MLKKIIFLFVLVFVVSCNKSEVAKQGDQPIQGTQPICQDPDPVDPPICEKFVLNKNLKSNALRKKGSASIHLFDEIVLAAAGNLPDNYVQISNPFIDHESVTSLASTEVELSDCGNTNENESIEKRIEHCKLLNAELASWDGEIHGAYGEIKWSLVSKIGPHQVWRDENTKLIWSGTIGNTNWCQANGDNKHTIISTNNQNITVDCKRLGTEISVCADNSKFIEQKGNILNASWRLPTRNDYLLADINGLRAIYNQASENLYFWTSTSFSVDFSYGWVFGSRYGDLTRRLRLENLNIRCVGRGN